jgi:hypothetical protein
MIGKDEEDVLDETAAPLLLCRKDPEESRGRLLQANRDA